MDERPAVLLTNDDGIDSPGLRALYESLSSVAEVTAVAPAEDQSAVGRSLSGEVPVADHDLGYVVEGTPADCVVAGLEALTPDADLVVSGVNRGANLGAYAIGRSGTVGAAVEAAFFGVPAMAVSMYIAAAEDITWRDRDTARSDYAGATRAATYLSEHAPAAGVFEQCDLLNVNVPDPGVRPRGMAVTRPSRVYDMTAEYEDGRVTLADRIWERMAAGDIPDPDGTDRRAVVEGLVSVSPLTAPHTTEHHEALDELARTYEPAE